MNSMVFGILLEVKQDSNLQSSTEAPADLKALSRGFIAYVVIGVILILVNTPIVVSILKHGELRNKKEYLLLAGSCIAIIFEALMNFKNFNAQKIILPRT
jgi:hypothetical protein